MQCTADFHHQVAHPGFPDTTGLVTHAATFDAAVDMFDAHPSPSEPPILRFLRSRQLLAAGLLRRLEEVHPVQRNCLKAHILPQLAPCWPWVRRGVGDALVMDTAWTGLTQEEEAQGPIDQQKMFQHVPLFLAAITPVLFSRGVGARDGSLGAIMTKRGAPGGVVGRTSSAGDGSSGRCGTSPPRRSRKASTRRQGASPKVRRVLRHTGSKT
jgi:hypothetical protein